ncbi:hypothetical protein VTN77DRAFT_671 [Rasamsonia byssochlamydoides]|uniref:uncharacterized protein n=1 Tax=Rasamsonia byssochlamydoides TaxID=89139 RepID=UPI00374211E1
MGSTVSIVAQRAFIGGETGRALLWLLLPPSKVRQRDRKYREIFILAGLRWSMPWATEQSPGPLSEVSGMRSPRDHRQSLDSACESRLISIVISRFPQLLGHDSRQALVRATIDTRNKRLQTGTFS